MSEQIFTIITLVVTAIGLYIRTIAHNTQINAVDEIEDNKLFRELVMNNEKRLDDQSERITAQSTTIEIQQQTLLDLQKLLSQTRKDLELKSIELENLKSLREENEQLKTRVSNLEALMTELHLERDRLRDEVSVREDTIIELGRKIYERDIEIKTYKSVLESLKVIKEDGSTS